MQIGLGKTRGLSARQHNPSITARGFRTGCRRSARKIMAVVEAPPALTKDSPKDLDLTYLDPQVAASALPAGVSSPDVLFRGVGGCPFVVESAKGAYMYDAAGNKHIDYLQAFGPMILGHAHPEIVEVLQEQIVKGTLYGMTTALEAKLAAAIVDRYVPVETVRFVTSGSEATLGALRIMRSFTRRSKVLKFKNGYHGHGDPFQVTGKPSTETQEADGITQNVKGDTLLATYNDVASVAEVFKQHPGEVACIYVEPMLGNHGALPPSKAFLQGLRDLCTENGALLCFDEVLCGFRCAKGGAYELSGVKPDMVTMGKIIGGGMPVAAIGGRKDVMAMLYPDGSVFQGGTYAGAPICLAAGLKQMEIIGRPGAYERLNEMSGKLAKGLVAAAEAQGHAAWACSFGGMMGFAFSDRPLETYEDLQAINRSKYEMFVKGVMERGLVWWPKMTGLVPVSMALTEADIDETIAIATETFKTIPVDLEGESGTEAIL